MYLNVLINILLHNNYVGIDHTKIRKTLRFVDHKECRPCGNQTRDALHSSEQLITQLLRYANRNRLQF